MLLSFLVVALCLHLASAETSTELPESSPTTTFSSSPPRTVAPELPNRAINASNQLAFSLYQLLLPLEDKNYVMSPLSLGSALAMLYLGARTVSEAELANALEYKRFGLDQTTVHSGFRSLLDRFRSSGRTEAYTLEIVNLVLVQNGYSVIRDYQTLLNDFYQARIQNVDFVKEGEATKNKVNEFVAHTTRNQISEVLSETLDSDTRAFLMNAVYYKGEWRTKFDQRFTKASTFYESGVRPRSVPTMNIKSKFPYAKFLNSTAIELPYQGGDISMIIILPQQRDGLRELESSIINDPSLLETIPFQESIVDVSMPRFNLESGVDVIPLLRKLGANSPFDQEKADLSGISGHRDLFVSKAIHESVLKVDEDGSEASAFSGIATGIRIGGPPAPLFVADHPFFFYIKDKSTGTILFMGRINNP